MQVRRPEDAKYVLVTVAYNEELQIDQTIQSVLKQSIRPTLWLVFSDGSTDRTDQIIKEYSITFPWIRYLRLEKTGDPGHGVTMASQATVRAMAEARRTLAAVDYDFIGNLDADITFEHDYYRRIIAEALADEELGIVGGGADNVGNDGKILPGGFIQSDFVGGPVQFFRKQCMDDIQGYRPYGHADVSAVFMARMKGWKVRCFPEIRALHHGQPGYTLRERTPICFRLGRIDHDMGGYLPFILGRCVLQLFRKPYFVGGVAMLSGFLWASLQRRKSRLPPDLAIFMRTDQKQMIRMAFKRGRRLSRRS